MRRPSVTTHVVVLPTPANSSLPPHEVGADHGDRRAPGAAHRAVQVLQDLLRPGRPAGAERLLGHLPGPGRLRAVAEAVAHHGEDGPGEGLRLLLARRGRLLGVPHGPGVAAHLLAADRPGEAAELDAARPRAVLVGVEAGEDGRAPAGQGVDVEDVGEAGDGAQAHPEGPGRGRAVAQRPGRSAMPGPVSVASTSREACSPSSATRRTRAPSVACRWRLVAASVAAISTEPTRSSSIPIRRASRAASRRAAMGRPTSTRSQTVSPGSDSREALTWPTSRW